MRFWDTSAIVPLVLREESTPVVTELLSNDPGIIAWWGTYVEAVSALARLQREAHLTLDKLQEAIESLEGLLSGATIIHPDDQVRATAKRLLLAHPLRGPDALQLAAALIAVEGQSEDRGLVSLDHRLRAAAETEGFTVHPAE